MDIYPEMSRYFWLRTRVNIEHRPNDLALVLDSEDVRDVFVNGELVKQSGTTTLWTRDNVVYSVAKHFKAGENTIVIRFERSPLYARIIADGTYGHPRRLPIVVLTGHFSVNDACQVPVVGTTYSGSPAARGNPPGSDGGSSRNTASPMAM